MGNQLSLTEEELADMKQNFDEEDLKKLFRRFQRLDVDKSGSLSVDEFLAIPELEHNPLVRRVLAAIDSDDSGDVDFAEFVSALAVFSSKGPDSKEKKYRFTFQIYDVDGDGYISNADLYKVLLAMVGSNLSPVQLQQLVDRTILQGDLDKDGRLSYEEFVNMVKNTDLDMKLALDVGAFNS